MDDNGAQVVMKEGLLGYRVRVRKRRLNSRLGLPLFI